MSKLVDLVTFSPKPVQLCNEIIQGIVLVLENSSGLLRPVSVTAVFFILLLIDELESLKTFVSCFFILM